MDDDEFNNMNNNNNDPNSVRIRLPCISLGTQFYENYNQRYTSKEAREESYLSFIKNFICPNLELISPTTGIALLNILIYLIMVLFGVDENDKANFLPIRSKTLDIFGNFNIEKMQSNQITQFYRWIMNIFLYPNLTFLTINTIGLLLIGSIIEKLTSKLTFIGIFFISGFMGTASTSYANKDITVGINTPLYGLFGAFVTCCCFNWKEMKRMLGEWGCFYLLYVNIMYFSFSFIYYLSFKQINVLGHMTGTLFGFWSFLALMKLRPDETEFKKNIKYIMLVCLCIYSVFTFGYFYIAMK